MSFRLFVGGLPAYASADQVSEWCCEKTRYWPRCQLKCKREATLQVAFLGFETLAIATSVLQSLHKQPTFQGYRVSCKWSHDIEASAYPGQGTTSKAKPPVPPAAAPSSSSPAGPAVATTVKKETEEIGILCKIERETQEAGILCKMEPETVSVGILCKMDEDEENFKVDAEIQCNLDWPGTPKTVSVAPTSPARSPTRSPSEAPTNMGELNSETIDAAEKVKVKKEIEELEDEIQEMKEELQSELDN